NIRRQACNQSHGQKSNTPSELPDLHFYQKSLLHLLINPGGFCKLSLIAAFREQPHQCLFHLFFLQPSAFSAEQALPDKNQSRTQYNSGSPELKTQRLIPEYIKGRPCGDKCSTPFRKSHLPGFVF